MGVARAIDITPQQRKLILSLFNLYFPNNAVWAYGSRVKWTAKPSSDLDLVVFSAPEESAELSLLREAFDESDLPSRVDLFVWGEVPEQFRKNIEAEHVVLSESREPGAGGRHQLLWEFAGGMVPDHWEFRSIESLLDTPKSISVGVMYPGANVDDGVPLIRVSDVKDGRLLGKPDFCVSTDVDEKYKRTRLNGTELLITLVGNPGDCVIATEEMAGWNVTRALAVVRLKDPKLRAWMRYVLLSAPAQHLIDSRLNTTVQRTLNLKDIKELGLPIPPENERDAISKSVATIEDKIQLNRQMNETLEAMAQALFKSWFVDFDPVIDNALAAGNEIPEVLQAKAAVRQALAAQANPRQPLPEHIRQQFPNAFQFNERMGWIPEGWGSSSLDHVAGYLNGLALQNFRPEDENGFLPIVKRAQLKKGVSTSEEKASPNIKPEYIIDDGDVIFSWSGSLVVDIWCGGKAALNQHLFKVTSDKYPKWFYLYFTRHHLVEFKRIAEAKAVTMGDIKREHLRQAICVIPPVDVINSGSEMLGVILDKLIKTRIENKSLIKLRDTLLPRLLSGELRIPEAETLMKEVV